MTKKQILKKLMSGRKKWWNKADLREEIELEAAKRGLNPGILGDTVSVYIRSFNYIKRKVGPNTWEYRLV